jgi:hypothetical protein
VHFGIEAL